MKLVLPPSGKNWLSLTGAIIAVTALFMIVFLFIAASVIREQAAYLGLVTFILLPAVMIFGLLLIPVGMFLKHRRQTGGTPETGWPKIDLDTPQHRHAFFIFIFGTAFFLLISAVGSYEAFHYTESTQFCGTLCHRVMEPEHVAHNHSPHAQVACVACHVGPGADWYVRSKLSGLYQVYAVTFNKYPRPIPTPIKNLRPARAVCEQCHWPQTFNGQKLLVRTHYLRDRDNTPWRIGLSLKLGPQEAALGLVEGIHWHTNPRVRIEYIATDPGRQQIPWVRYTNLDNGVVKTFRDGGQAGSPPPAGAVRTMDCIDCHNRPSHLYRAPAQFVDTALAAGRLPAALPEIKKIAVQLCAAEYPSAAAARQALAAGLEQFYRNSYPDIFSSRREAVTSAATALQKEYAENIFPDMKVRWNAYPDNIGHLYFSGCFRCHNTTHRSESGETIGMDCTICHDLSIQGVPGKSLQEAKVGESLPFRHPQDIGTSWQDTPCAECHTGGNP